MMGLPEIEKKREDMSDRLERIAALDRQTDLP